MGAFLMRRELGIDTAEVLEPHDHVGWFGDGAADLYSLAGVALKAGARRREKLLFVAEDPDPGRLAGIGDLERLLQDGQLELLSVDSVYGGWDAFSASAQLATFEEVLGQALADGYRGIRVLADNTPLVCGEDDGFRRWLEWEQVTDRFQAGSAVTGICYFDRNALTPERRSDLAALHPVRQEHTALPPFTIYASGDAVMVTGTLDAWSAPQFRRLIEAAPDGPLVIDFSEVEFADHRALLALNDIAGPDRPVNISGAKTTMCRLASLLNLEMPYLRIV